jgi:hypothetical protein
MDSRRREAQPHRATRAYLPHMAWRRISRDDLYGLVWAQPMQHLGIEFGITGNGLAKICDRLEIPYPSRGYWNKKAAGISVVQVQLPKRPSGVPDCADILPTSARLEPLNTAEIATYVSPLISDVTISSVPGNQIYSHRYTPCTPTTLTFELVVPASVPRSAFPGCTGV